MDTCTITFRSKNMARFALTQAMLAAMDAELRAARARQHQLADAWKRDWQQYSAMIVALNRPEQEQG